MLYVGNAGRDAMFSAEPWQQKIGIGKWRGKKIKMFLLLRFDWVRGKPSSEEFTLSPSGKIDP